MLEGWVVKDVAALPPRDLMLVLERSTEPNTGIPDTSNDTAPVRRLRLSASADFPRVHLQHGRVFRHKGPSGPFFTNASEALTGAKLRKCTQVAGDRILRFEFLDASAKPVHLLVELCGRQANLLLTDSSGKIRSILVAPPKSSHKSKGAKDKTTVSDEAPRLQVGGAWSPPPGQTGGSPGDSLLEDLEEPQVPAEEQPRFRGAPLSWRVEAHLGSADSGQHEQRTRKQLLDRIRRRLKRARSNLAGLEKKRTAADGAEEVKQQGELLKAHLGQFKRGAKEVELTDFFSEDTPQIKIQLDPKLDPSQNVERLFARYHKLLRSAANLDEEFERAERRLHSFEELLKQASDEAKGLDELNALSKQAEQQGLLDARQEADPRKQKEVARRLPYKTYQTQSGLEVWVGRTARDNDELTIKLARGNDWWLHTANAPGSHVLLRSPKTGGKGWEPEQEDLLDAAHLAVHFSPLKQASRADVHVARRKEIHKPKGAKPGLVHLSGGKTFHVRMQPERLKRLLEAGRH